MHKMNNMLGLVGNFQFIKVSEFNPPSLTTILKYQEDNSFLIPSSKGLPISPSPSMIILQKKKKLICLISKHFRINNSLYLSSSHLLSYPISSYLIRGGVIIPYTTSERQILVNESWFDPFCTFTTTHN